MSKRLDESLALLDDAIAQSENKRDEMGYLHWHEVPSKGQFRLMSCCTGCDALYDATVFS